jgi:imidazolonepropionase-like amidohydrolase
MPEGSLPDHPQVAPEARPVDGGRAAHVSEGDDGGITAIVGGHVVCVDAPPISRGTLLVADGRITAVGGPDLAIPEGARIIDATGRWVVPGLIDAHTHVGIHEEGNGWAGQDTNETTESVTAQVRAIDAINPADLAFADAVAGGILAVNVNPGSANPIGGQTVALRTWGRTVDEMVLRHPSGMKSALGENPKRFHGDQKRMPNTRLGTAAVIRAALAKAADYQAKLDRAGSSDQAAPDRDLVSEALGPVLRRELPWRQHVHRADDIATALRIRDEFGYDLVIDHGTEAHLVADLLAERGVPVIIGPLLVSRSKVEVVNRSFDNPGILDRAGVTIALMTDHPVVPVEHLITQAALSVRAGLDPEAALRAMTINPARILGVDDRIGSLAVGKDADFCLWTGDPLDLTQRVSAAYLGGRQIYRWDESARRGVWASR